MLSAKTTPLLSVKIGALRFNFGAVKVSAVLLMKVILGTKIKQQKTIKIKKGNVLKKINFFIFFCVCNLLNFVDFFIH